MHVGWHADAVGATRHPCRPEAPNIGGSYEATYGHIPSLGAVYIERLVGEVWPFALRPDTCAGPNGL